MDDKALLIKLQHRYIDDLRKDELDVFERASIIQAICKEECLSMRAFANKYNFKRATVQDWVRIGSLTPDEVETLKEEGINNTQIYRALRKGINIKENINKPEVVAREIKNMNNKVIEEPEVVVREIRNMNNTNDKPVEILDIKTFVSTIDNLHRNRNYLLKLVKNDPDELPAGYVETLNAVAEMLKKSGMYLKLKKR